MAKRSFWAWGTEADEPTSEQMKAASEELVRRYKVGLTPVVPPRASDLSLRKPLSLIHISEPTRQAAM